MIMEEVEQDQEHPFALVMCHHTYANKADLLKMLMTPMMDGSNSNAFARIRIQGISIIYII
jgi:hypothetical protein